mgnify:CR=1 FL=1
MLIYKRNITSQLVLLRFVFLLTIGICIYLFQSNKEDYSFVLLFLLACGSVFPVTGLVVTQDVLTIRQYYVYGLFYSNWRFHINDNVEIQPFDLEVSDAGYLHTDEWWDAFFAFWPTSKVKIKKFIIKRTDVIGNKTQIKTSLSDKEQMIIQELYNR